MASLIDRIHSAMSKLSQRSWDDDSLIHTKMKDFEDEIDFLARFVDCIGYRSNALELAPHLGSVVTKVEASVQKIGGKFLEKMNRTKWASVCSVISFNWVGSSEKKESKWIDAFNKWVSMMFSLRPDVADALDSLSINLVHCKILVHDFPKWERFVISTYKHVQDVQGNSVRHYGRPERRSEVILVVEPSYLESLLGNLENDHVKDPKIEAFLTKLGSSIISAELSCFRWWSSNYSTQRKEDISAALRDLDWMIWLTNPEFVDVILRILKTSQRFSTIADLVVNRTIAGLVVLRPIADFFANNPTTNLVMDRTFADLVRNRPITELYWKDSTQNIIFNTLVRQLISLITSVLKIPEEDNMMVKMFLFDTKQLLMEAASQRHSHYDGENLFCAARNLVEKIGLIKTEILLRKEITGDISIYEENMEISSLNEIVHDIKEASDGSTSSTKIKNRILTLMERVVEERAMIQESEPMVVRNLLLKTLFFKVELMFLKLHDSLSGSFKDYIESLHEGFKLMVPFVINQYYGDFIGGKTGFPVVESVANRSLLYITRF